MKLEIFLDQDEVLSNFLDPVAQMMGLSADVAAQCRLSGDYIRQHPNQTDLEIQRFLKEKAPDLFFQLPVTPWAEALVELAFSLTPHVYVLTRHPDWDPDGAAQKIRWLQKHFDYMQLSTRVIMTRHKSLLAASNRLLIDDSTHNVQPWIDAGGRAVIFNDHSEAAVKRKMLHIEQEAEMIIRS